MAEWSIAAVLKTVILNRIVSSNLTLSSILRYYVATPGTASDRRVFAALRPTVWYSPLNFCPLWVLSHLKLMSVGFRPIFRSDASMGRAMELAT